MDDGAFCVSQVVSGPAVEGVCGYGDTSQTLFPRMNVASVSAANPGRICGTCIQVRCLQVMPANQAPCSCCRAEQVLAAFYPYTLHFELTACQVCADAYDLLQKNCTTTRPFIVQVVDSCGSKCSPNELQLPVDTYTTSLAPSNFSQVLVQYRVVRHW